MLSELAAKGIDLDVFVAWGQHQVKAVQKASSLSEKVRQFQLLAWGDLSIIDTAITPENKLVCVDLINGHNDVQGKHHKPTTMSKMEVLRKVLHVPSRVALNTPSIRAHSSSSVKHARHMWYIFFHSLRPAVAFRTSFCMALRFFRSSGQ